MGMNKKLDKLFRNSEKLFIDDGIKLVIMSDCHRGEGDINDNFIKNQSIYKNALTYYYNNNFTYVELGDGDDMWEVKKYENIIKVHLDTFKQLKKFYDANRLIMIYGNHDIVKKSSDVLKKYFYKYYDEVTKKEEPLLEGLQVYESLVLNYSGHDIFLLHGHQVDFLNSTLWLFSRFFVKYGWKVLESMGVKNITNTSKNYQVIQMIERKLKKWSIENNKMIVAGHTHRAIFPKIGDGLYFNDGTCIYPDGITCLEIENGNITLVKWIFEVNDNNTLSVNRKVLDGNKPIINFFS